VSVYHFDMAQKLKRAFAEWQREQDAKREQERRTAEQLKFAAAWGERHEPKNPEAL
jgi:hypothetical protein